MRVSDDLIYVKDRLKAAWILYRTVARALPTDDVCRNDGERYGVPRFCGQSPRYDFPSCRVGGLQVGLTVFALSLALSHGERARERAKPFGMPLSRFSKKHPFKTDTDKRDCRAWMSDLVP